MISEIDYRNALALLMKCEELQDSCVQHEWLMDDRKDAVRLSNYLRSRGYEVKNEIRKPIGIIVYYVGVPFSTLKTKTP